MCELEWSLTSHDPNIRFDRFNNCIHCFPHIINICTSHVIQSCTRSSEKIIKSLGSEHGSSNVESDDDRDNINNDDDDYDYNDEDDDDDGRAFIPQTGPELQFDKRKLSALGAEEQAWLKAAKCNPVKRACKVICIIWSSDTRKQDFKQVIINGNKSGWFQDSKGAVIQVANRELLCDVKTRWDSVYLMIGRLLEL